MRSADPAPARGLPLVAHAGLLVVGLAVALALTERDVPFTVDEGSYAIQAEAVADGGWAIHWPFRAVDPEAEHFPYHGGRVTDTAEYAYVSHPAWPAALSVARDVGPEGVGLRLLPLASVVAAAAVAWALAGRLAGPAAAPWAFWVVAASPLLADGFIVWAHAPAAALAGLAALAAVRLTDDHRRPDPWVLLVLAIGAAVLLRSELLLFAGALAVTLGAVGLRARRPALLTAAALTAATTLGTVLLERAWIRDIAGGGGQDLGSRAGGEGLLSGRLSGAGTVLVEAASDSAGAALCSVLALGLVVAGAVAHRQGARWSGPPPVALLGGAAALTALRIAAGPDDPVSGLLVAWPVVALLGLLTLADDRRLLALLGGSALFILAVLATQYDDGGGLQWGGRYLAPVLVPLGVAVAAVVATRLDRPERLAVAGLLGATAVLTLVVPDQVRRDNADGIEAVDATDAKVVLVHGDQLARLDWARWPERCWLADGDDLAGAVSTLRAAEVDRFGTLLVPIGDLRALDVEAAPTSRAATVVQLGPTEAGRCP